MKEKDAKHMLRRLEFYVQKARSDMMEGLGVSSEDSNQVEVRVLRELHPWLFGAKCILLPLHNLNQRIEKGAPLSAIDFANMMYVVDRTPALQIMPALLGAGWNFPEWNPARIIAEWEAEPTGEMPDVNAD